MSQPSTLPSTGPAAPAPPAPWRERTLARLVQHVRTVLPVSGVAFLTDDADGDRPVGWFVDDSLRVAMEASMRRLTRGRPLLLARVEAWQAAPELMDAIAEELDQ